MTNDYNIPRNHMDIGLRSLAVMFKDEFLPFTGIQIPMVKDVIQTNVATIEMKDRGMDLNFLLEDDTIAPSNSNQTLSMSMISSDLPTMTCSYINNANKISAVLSFSLPESLLLPYKNFILEV
ncbi:hypothetical protein [Fredinandcohnia onubensis]|uniref:hypothetical protein n=1 Tax=Fredinandcohnia onubensis TaxID=1571209 RepID=UPI000C0BB967|nr:hypothetical protein [Fredinandcohnia onubensis]